MIDQYRIFRLSAEKIFPNPAQPRENFDEEKLNELAESIRENGLLQPITVRKTANGHYEIVAGERRYRAARMVGFKTIPCVIADCSELQSAAFAMIENMQRCDLDCFEEAAAIKALMDSSGMTQEEVSHCLGKSQSSVANKLRLLKLTDEERELIRKGKLTERHGRALLRISDSEKRINVLKVIIRKGLNVKQTEEFIEQSLKKRSAAKRKFIPKDISLFLNTVEHAVDTVRKTGLDAKMQKNETDTFIECIIRIPKNNSSQKVEEA